MVGEKGTVFTLLWRDSIAKNKARSLGLDKASTFPGFCHEHDSGLFKKIENGVYDVNAKQDALLMGYRAACYEYRISNAVLHVASISNRKHSRINHLKTLHGNAKRLKAGFENDLFNEKLPSKIESCNIILRTYTEYGVGYLAAGVINLLYLNGVTLNGSGFACTTLKLSSRRLVFQISWLKEETQYRRAIDELLKDDGAKIAIFMAICCPNLYFSKKFYNSLSPEWKSNLTTLLSKYTDRYFNIERTIKTPYVFYKAIFH